MPRPLRPHGFTLQVPILFALGVALAVGAGCGKGERASQDFPPSVASVASVETPPAAEAPRGSDGEEPALAAYAPTNAVDGSWQAWVVPRADGSGADLFFRAKRGKEVMVSTNGDPRTVTSSPDSRFLIFMDSSPGDLAYDSLFALPTQEGPLQPVQLSNIGVAELSPEQRAITGIPNPSSDRPIIWDSESKFHYPYKDSCVATADLTARTVTGGCRDQKPR